MRKRGASKSSAKLVNLQRFPNFRISNVNFRIKYVNFALRIDYSTLNLF